MTIRQYFLDDVEDNRHEYDMQDFARFHSIVFGGNGFSNKEDTDNMKYEAVENMKGKVGTGYVEYDGYVMEISDSETLEHDAADPDHDRIDVVVARFKFNPEEAKFTVDIVKGTPDSSPSTPDLADDSKEYEKPIAEVLVKADESTIKDENITDKRKGEYIPIDNLQRGVKVDEHGLVTMPNQSFVKVVHTTGQGGFKVPDDESIPIPMDDAEIDRQNEIKDGEKGLFVPKADGAYIFYEHVAFDEGELNEDSDVRLQLYVNGDYVTTLTARTPAHRKDNIFDGSAIEFLEGGDEVEFKIIVAHAPDDLEVRNHRLFISKLN